MKPVSLFAPGVGELSFDSRGAIISALDVAYPEIKRLGADTASGDHTLSLGVGGGKLTLEGYFIDEQALAAGETENFVPASNGAASETRAEASESRGAAARLKRLLSSIAAPGREFRLTVGERSRALYALSLSFAAEAPFSSPYAEKFKLVAYSDDPYFHGGDAHFAGTSAAASLLSFPAHGAFTVGEQQSGGSVVIGNDGDETCGFVLKARFTSAATALTLESDREDGSFSLEASIAAGETVVIDTRNGRRAVFIEGGESLLSCIDADCAFFRAPPGRTTLTWSAQCDEPPVVSVCITPGWLNV